MGVRYLAIDLGDKRTGLALGDTTTRIVSPVGVVEVPVAERGGEVLLGALAKAVGEQLGPPSAGCALLIGLPLNMDGSEGPRAKSAREFGARVAAKTGHAVVYHDERLTSAAADWTMAGSGLTHGQKKARRDALAAKAILEDYLRGLAEGAGPLDPS